MANKYQKQFYIFKSMDNDVGNPSGYIKIEINGEQAKLQLSLNNLLNKQGFIYQLYGITKDDRNLSYTVICDIPNINGRADVKVNANCLDLDKINIYAIILRVSGNLPKIKCPLVAYVKEELDWKNEFNSLIFMDERSQDKNNQNYAARDSLEKGFYESESIKNTENINNSIKTDKNFSDDLDQTINNRQQLDGKNIRSRDEINEIEKADSRSETSINTNKIDSNQSDELNNYTERVLIHEGSNAAKENTSYDTIESNISKIEEISDGEKSENIESIENTSDKSIEIHNEENRESIECEKKEDVHININNTEMVDEKRRAVFQPNNQLFNDMKLNFSGKFESVITSIYNADKSATLTSIYNNATAKKEPELNLDDNDILGSVEENFKDISSIELDKIKGRAKLNLPDLKDELNKSFESYNPFKMKSKNFSWWKINSPGYLNNILFRNNIRTYLFFNPKVMLAHYKYRYIIFGIRVDRRTGKEYFICGIPGVYSIDENPFGSMGSWAQTEGYKPKYGAFGYWLIMIDPKTGKLIKVR